MFSSEEARNSFGKPLNTLLMSRVPYFKTREKKEKEERVPTLRITILHLPLPVFKYHIFIFVVTNDPSRLLGSVVVIDRFALVRTWFIRGKRKEKEERALFAL